jgi:hypothetical protein
MSATLRDLQIILDHVPEHGYGIHTFCRDLRMSVCTPRIRWRHRVPRWIVGMALAMTKMTPEQLRDWRAELAFLCSAEHEE